MIKILAAFSFQLSKVEVINTYLAKFQVKIPIGIPLFFKRKVQVSLAAITRFKKWPRIT